MGDDPTNDIASAIAAALAPVLGEGVQITGLRPLTSGASRQSWRFDASAVGGPARTYVLQHDWIAGGIPGRHAPLSMQAQAAVIEAARAAGVPAAAVIASGDWAGKQYIVAEWVEGEALPPRLLRRPDLERGRQQLMKDCADALVAIHRIPPEGLGLEAIDRLAGFRAQLDTMDEPRPVLELGYRWLVANRPPERPPVVVHGDFRLGNLLVGGDGLAAVLDWELAHLGDPHEDAAWATIRAWRFDRHRPEGVFPEPGPWAEAYNEAAGPRGALDPGSLLWWQVAGTWSWAVISAMQARRHLDGWVQSLEHAVIGRRVCESEWDLLELLS